MMVIGKIVLRFKSFISVHLRSRILCLSPLVDEIRGTGRQAGLEASRLAFIFHDRGRESRSNTSLFE